MTAEGEEGGSQDLETIKARKKAATESKFGKNFKTLLKSGNNSCYPLKAKTFNKGLQGNFLCNNDSH